MGRDRTGLDEILKPRVLLRILFPEIQILEHMKRAGFINKEFFRRRGRAPVINRRKNERVAGGPTGKTLADRIYEASNTASDALGQTAENISSATGNFSRDVSTNIKANKNRQEMNDGFDLVEGQIPQYVLGQSEYIPKLSIAFKRPFIMGKDTGFSNIIFITGPSGSGRHLSVKVITRLLRNEKILKNGKVFSLDLSRYQVERDAENLFLPDLYNALYGPEPVVVFDNFEKAHQSVMDMLIKLGIDERLELNKRYREQLGRMTEVTGSLEMNATDAILANGKYLVFITEKDEKSIRNFFSTRFMEKVYDIISTSSLPEDVLRIISNHKLGDYIEKIGRNLSIEVEFNSEVSNFVVLNSNRALGAHGLFDYIENNVYNPLVELELNKKLLPGNRYLITLGENGIEVMVGETRYILTQVLKRRNNEAIEELSRELEGVIGLDSVKRFIRTLEDNIKVQRARESMGEVAAKLSLHMIFTGNPGTGKTTMARIMARYLKELGYLSSGHLVEVSRGDLVGQYVGETAQKTIAKINSAKGGVLFIDEAYSLVRDENDIFGIEAVDTLVKAMEDNRENLVVILAGYSREMEEFLKSNSGLKSRFNYVVDFPDYTPEELLRISKVIVKSNGYFIPVECEDELLKLFESRQIKGKNDSGNGRLARNIVEQAIANQSRRLAASDLSKLSKEELSKLNLHDFGLDKKEELNLEEELSKIVGLEDVKNFIKSLQKQLVAREKRRAAGIKVQGGQSLNMIFTGNPGTGKTTVARIIGNLMRRMGALKSGHIIETDRSGLVGQYVGETSKKTTEIFTSALGGVLFIDEAYALISGSGDNFGKEAVDTLVKLIEDHREDIVVILAGYEEEMKEFLKSNSGLKSRFPLHIDFRDYNIDELVEIGKKIVASKGFMLSQDAEDEFREYIYAAKRKTGTEGGNGRLVRNVVEEAIRRQSSRIADMNEVAGEELVLLREEDFQDKNVSNESFNLEEKLSRVIGLEEVKAFIRSLQAQLKIREQRKMMGLSVDSEQTLHMIFMGNPGTGKTTMARIIGDVLYNLGVLKSRNFVETDRSGLVAGYVGQTAIKTREKIDNALGGILFIDEAYALAEDAGGGSGFGKEAIDTLVKGMDDNRDNLVVILAGYSEDMERFLSTNPGLRSRFANIIEFKDYSVDELMQIADKMFASKGYIITQVAKQKMAEIFMEARSEEDFGNGRYVRNIFEKALRNQAVRLQNEGEITREKLSAIEEQDIERV